MNDHEYGQMDGARQSSYKLNTVIIYIVYQDSASNKLLPITNLKILIFDSAYAFSLLIIFDVAVALQQYTATSKMVNCQSQFSFVCGRHIFRVKSKIFLDLLLLGVL